MANPKEPTIGETVDAAKTVGEAVATGGESLAADPMATARLANEAPKIIRKSIKMQLTCCAGLFFFSIFAGLFVINLFNPDTSVADTTGSVGTSACGATVDSLVSGVNMMPYDANKQHVSEGKLGNEQHLDDTKPTHFCGTGSGSCTSMVHTGFVSSHTTDQEHWAINARWVGWTLDGMSKTNGKGDSKARSAIRHAKVVVTLEQPGKPAKSLITSVEEWGPNIFKDTQDGIQFGAVPEVRHYLGGSDGNTGNPNDKKNLIKIAFAADQNAAVLGPCK